MTARACGLVLLVLAASCGGQETAWRAGTVLPPSLPPSPPPTSPAPSAPRPAEPALTTSAAVPGPALDASKAMATLPLTPTPQPAKVVGSIPIPGGKVHNRSARDVFAIGSLGGGAWEILRVPAGATVGGELLGAGPFLTRDVDWISAVPPVADPGGGFSYAASTPGVKISDAGELTVLDGPDDGVRFDMATGPIPSTAATVGQMNGGSPVLHAPRR